MERFIEKHPLAVLTRGAISRLIGEPLDEVFQQNRSRQYDETIKFSAVATAMGEIALGTVPNRNQAYRKHHKELRASATAFYGKLNRTEPAVSEGVVRYSARSPRRLACVERAGELLEELDFEPWEVLPGYRAFSPATADLRLDGNHLGKTEKRLTETRGLCAAPLPGTVVARFDHQTGLERLAKQHLGRRILGWDKHSCLSGQSEMFGPLKIETLFCNALYSIGPIFWRTRTPRSRPCWTARSKTLRNTIWSLRTATSASCPSC